VKQRRRDPRGGSKAAVAALSRAREVSPPETAALKHQTFRWLHRGLAPSCSKCALRDSCPEFREEKGASCVLAEREHAAIVAEVMALPWAQEGDRHLALSFAKVTVGLNIIDAYLSVESPFLPGAPAYIEPQPILATRANLLSSQVKLAAQLGLSPAARARLQADPDRGPASGILRAFAELEAEDREARERAQALDAEFVAEDTPGDAEDAPGGAVGTSEDSDGEATG